MENNFGMWKNYFGRWENYFDSASGKIILAGGEIILTGGKYKKKKQKRNLIHRFTNTKPQIWK